MAVETIASDTTANGSATNGSTPAHGIETRLFINGKFVNSSNNETFKLISPTTLKVVAEVAEASVEDTNAAVLAAKAAQPAWASLSPSQRGHYMKQLAGLIRESHDELAHLEAISMGRPVSGYFEASAAANRFEYFAETGYLAQGSTSLNTPGFVNMTFRQPFGVVAAIIPWNVPVLFFASKVAPAIAAGNCVVLKSSEKAPLTSAKVATLIEKVGFPPGVINVLSGGPIPGATLSSHMDVRCITFTGSGRTGRLIQQAAGKSNVKNVILELGGKSPAIIFDDCDLETAVQETQYSIQWNSGQVCMANSRIYVQDTIVDRFISLFKEKFSQVNMGDPLQKETNHGPLADQIQHNTVSQYIQSGKESGNMILGGEDREPNQGYFIRPTIFTNTPEDAKIMKEEVFGPVVNINAFHSEQEALSMANDTEYGLYAAVYTKNIDRAMRFAQGLEAGSVGVNCTSPINPVDLPFGGYKASGLGREGIKESLDNFLEVKTVMIKVFPS